MRRSYADMLKDDDEAMKIISPTYRELGKKKYDEMMEQKQREIEREMKELRLKQVEELKEILNNNSKNKEDSDTLIIYDYDLRLGDYMNEITQCFLKALYEKYGRVHFISFDYFTSKHESRYICMPHDVIELTENLYKLNWHHEFFEHNVIINSECSGISYLNEHFNDKYEHIYNYIFKGDDEKYVKKKIENIKENTLSYFKEENFKEIFNEMND